MIAHHLLVWHINSQIYVYFVRKSDHSSKWGKWSKWSFQVLSSIFCARSRLSIIAVWAARRRNPKRLSHCLRAADNAKRLPHRQTKTNLIAFRNAIILVTLGWTIATIARNFPWIVLVTLLFQLMIWAISRLLQMVQDFQMVGMIQCDKADLSGWKCYHTGSGVLYRWYEPESMVDIIHGTDYEFYRLTLLRWVNNTSAIGYTYTKVLFKSLHWYINHTICSDRTGESVGSCDWL